MLTRARIVCAGSGFLYFGDPVILFRRQGMGMGIFVNSVIDFFGQLGKIVTIHVKTHDEKEEDTQMNKCKAFLARKDIEISARRYGIDALGAMAQGLFCSLLIGTIINTVGQQLRH